MKKDNQDLTTSNINYFASKLSFLIHNMAVHEGDANNRLASESINISLIDPRAIPENYRKDFEKLQKTISKTLSGIHNDRTPHKLDGIRNPTVVKYIKLLWRIHASLEHT